MLLGIHSFALLLCASQLVDASPFFAKRFPLLRRQDGNDTLGVAAPSGLATASTTTTTTTTISSSSSSFIPVPLYTGISNPGPALVNPGNSSLNPFLVTGGRPSPNLPSTPTPPPQQINATVTTRPFFGTGWLPSSSSGIVPPNLGNGSHPPPLLGTGFTPGNPKPSIGSGNSSSNPFGTGILPPPGSTTSRPALGNGTANTPLILGTGVLPFVTTTPPPAVASSLTWSGSWSASSSQPSESLPFFLVPTTTIPPAEASSEAALLIPLFLALQRDREWITDDALKSQYIDNVEKTKDEVEALIFAIDPGADVEEDGDCSSSRKRKRSLGSEILIRDLLSKNILAGLGDLVTGLVKDLICADQHLAALIVAITAPVPPIPLIETLTDDLVDLTSDLDAGSNDDNNDDNSSSSQSSSTTSATCTSTATVTDCSITVSLSTSYISGMTDSSTVSSFTTTVCSTITACSATPTTAYTTVTTTGSTSIFCSPGCLACVAKRTATLPEATATPIPQISRPDSVARSVWDAANGTGLEARTIWDSSDAFVPDATVLGLIGESYSKELGHSMQGSTSITVSFDNSNKEVAYVTGIFGCTVVIIVSRRGVWMGHFWETPSMSNDQNFQSQILGPLQGNGGISQFSSPLSLGQGDGILNSDSQPYIYVSTPQRDGALLYDGYVNQMLGVLTGPGAPWEGVTPIVRGYDKPNGDVQADQWATTSARSKALVQFRVAFDDAMFSNNLDDPDPPEQAAWRVWLEQQPYTPTPDEWDATPEQIGCTTNGKRQDGAACSLPSNPSVSASGSASGSGPSVVITPTPGGPSNPSNSTITPAPSFPTLRPLNGTSQNPAPTPAPTAFTITGADGEITSCASSTVVDAITSCAGASSVIGTDPGVASAFSASASWSAAAATPSAGCYILDDDGFGDSAFLVYGINGWSGDDGESLWDQENGCGIVSGWDWETDGQSLFEGVWRNVQYVSFGLSFFKGGCVERAVHSAGGPEPGSGPGQLACQHGEPTLDQLSVPGPNNKNKRWPRYRTPTYRFDTAAAAGRIHEALMPNLQAVANGTWPDIEHPRTHRQMKNTIKLALTANVEDGPDEEVRKRAKEALRHMHHG